MLLNTEEYFNHLSKELPEFTFTGIEKVQDYKNNSEIYEINFTKELDEKIKEYSYRMVVGYLKFTEEKLKENFVETAKLTFRSKNKEDKEEVEK
jgi:hypothetical protein